MSFSQVAILIVVAGVFGIIAKLFRQPLIVGYIFGGIFASWFGIVEDNASLNFLGQIGVTLLLFLLGLEMRLSEVRAIGKAAVLTGIGQIVFTSIAGLLLLVGIGMSFVPALYIAVALCFSSTIIMVKLLSEKKELGSLYGRISVGFLLIQDVVAILILIFLSGVTQGPVTALTFITPILKTLFVVVLTWILSLKILPFIFDRLVGNSTELLFISSVAWALGFSYFVAEPLGLSLEIGGFLAGVALSSMPEHLQIAARTKPLKDFFLTIFFLYLGSKLAVGGEILNLVGPAVILSLFVLIGNPLIVAMILGYLGYKKRTSFLSGLTVAQTSEFSLILMTVGEKIGHLDSNHVSLVVLVGIITMTVSTYLIQGSERVFEKLKKHLQFLERKNAQEKAINKVYEKSGHVVLVGCDRTGRQLVSYFKGKNIDFLVVDFNPAVIEKLVADNVDVVFGDITDTEILEASGLSRSRMVISTISNKNDNLKVLAFIKTLDSAPASIFTSTSKQEALDLYEKGASYLIVPEVLAGEHIKHLLGSYGFGGGKLKDAGQNHFNRLIMV